MSLIDVLSAVPDTYSVFIIGKMEIGVLKEIFLDSRLPMFLFHHPLANLAIGRRLNGHLFADEVAIIAPLFYHPLYGELMRQWWIPECISTLCHQEESQGSLQVVH